MENAFIYDFPLIFNFILTFIQLLLMYELYNLETVLYHANTSEFHSLLALQPIIVVNIIILLHFYLTSQASLKLHFSHRLGGHSYKLVPLLH